MTSMDQHPDFASQRVVNDIDVPRDAQNPLSAAFAVSDDRNRTRTMSDGAHQNGVSMSLNNPSTFVCNVNRTTGITPHARIGATTTIVGDLLYMFGGRLLSGKKEVLSNSLHVLDLKTRCWRKLQPSGALPRARYFHSMCALGDEKLICFGGMALKATNDSIDVATASQPDLGGTEQLIQQADLVTLSDIFIYNIGEQQWHQINADRPPQSRYAHLATISPSSTVWTTPQASVSAIHAKQSHADLSLDPAGGAEMIILGGQNMHHEYIQQLDVFNFRSLSWTKSAPTEKKYGVYRSMAATLVGIPATQLGSGIPSQSSPTPAFPLNESEISTLIYSNYRFTDARLELDVRGSDGRIQEKAMAGETKPPGLRFPTGGIIDNHLVVSGTRLHETTHEYAFWTLDLATMTWSRLDVGTGVFSTGSWNRGLLWHRRNSFVILGDRNRDLPTDYKERRVNFTSFCDIELEAFGLYSSPRAKNPMSDFKSASRPKVSPGHMRMSSNLNSMCASTSGGRPHFGAAQELGRMLMNMREFSDMEFLTMTGERIPVNSRIVSKRWGPVFNQLLREGVVLGDGDSITLRPGVQARDRQSLLTITPATAGTDQASMTSATTLVGTGSSISSGPAPNVVPTPDSLAPSLRPRTLYLPHTPTTIQSLLHFLYTSSLPPTSSAFGTPQVLCSLLQLARPYQIDGLFEAIIERLHLVLDERNAPAIFNAAALASGDGSAIHIMGELSAASSPKPRGSQSVDFLHGSSSSSEERLPSGSTSGPEGLPSAADLHAAAESSNASQDSGSVSDSSSSLVRGERAALTRPSAPVAREDVERNRGRGRDLDAEPASAWTGSMSGVIGIQKRGLRKLIEGRSLRDERVGAVTTASISSRGQDTGSPTYPRLRPSAGMGQEQAAYAAAQSVGLGIVGRQ